MRGDPNFEEQCDKLVRAAFQIGGSQFGHPVSPAQVRAIYPINDEDFRSAVTWLKQQGMAMPVGGMDITLTQDGLAAARQLPPI